VIPLLVGTTVSISGINATVTITSIIKVTATSISTSVIVLVLLHWPVAAVVLHRATIRPLIYGESVTASRARSARIVTVELAISFSWWGGSVELLVTWPSSSLVAVLLLISVIIWRVRWILISITHLARVTLHLIARGIFREVVVVISGTTIEVATSIVFVGEARWTVSVIGGSTVEVASIALW